MHTILTSSPSLSLPLRYLFSKIPAPKERGPFLDRLLDLFLMQYKSCNEGLSYGTGEGRERKRGRKGERDRERGREIQREREYMHIHEWCLSPFSLSIQTH